MSLKHDKKSNPRSDQRVVKTLRIRTLDHLARRLKCTVTEIERFESDPESFYRYGEFIDTKGKVRPKAQPQKRLHPILQQLNHILQHVELSDCAHGGRRKRSYRTNATPHIAQPVLIKSDVRNFFPNISTEMVEAAFRFRCECSLRVAHSLAKITTPNNSVPQGAPHSTMVAAIVLEPMVKRLQKLATQHGANYTQFVDDISISGPAHIAKLKDLVIKIIRTSGFEVAANKTEVITRDQEQIVTGVRVNDGMDAPSSQMPTIRNLIECYKNDPNAVSLASLEGKIAAISSLNKGAGKFLRRQLRHATQT